MEFIHFEYPNFIILGKKNFKRLCDTPSTKLYKVLVDFQSYAKFKPVKKLYKTRQGSREYWRLQLGWTDLFLDTFWEQHKLPCTFSVLKHHVSHSGRGSFITFSGRCTDSACKSTFFADIENEPKADTDVQINFYSPDSTNIIHEEEKKRFLRFPKRKCIGEDVQRLGASQWRRQYADENMEYGDSEPPILYNSEVLRKAKQDTVDCNLGTSGPDPIRSLVEIKHGVEHSGSIDTICQDKFFVHYWSPLQCHVYKVICRQNWVTMSADATGSLILPLQRTSKKNLPDIFFCTK